MASHRKRPILIGAVVIVVAWVLAVAGYLMAKGSKMTAEKLRTFAESVAFGKLTGASRAKAMRDLAEKLNRLSPEERRKARLDRVWQRWFEEMTEEERGTFIDLTMPTGFKQMLASFEQLPEDKRRKSIDDALRRLKEAQAKNASGTNQPPGTNALSAELQAKVRTIGLKTFYSQSSAQTKAEMAPVLEELQKVMESGRPFRGR